MKILTSVLTYLQTIGKLDTKEGEGRTCKDFHMFLKLMLNSEPRQMRYCCVCESYPEMMQPATQLCLISAMGDAHCLIKLLRSKISKLFRSHK